MTAALRRAYVATVLDKQLKRQITSTAWNTPWPSIPMATRSDRYLSRRPACQGASANTLACLRCGGRLRGLAYAKGAGGVRAIVEQLGLPTASAHLTPARGPLQSAGC